MPEIAGHRLRRTGLTRGDIGGSRQPGKINPETGLLGCPERIRTFESRDAWQTLGRLAFNFHRRKEWTSAAIGASRAIGEPKSKLSKRVAQLEWDLVVRLIERSGKRRAIGA